MDKLEHLTAQYPMDRKRKSWQGGAEGYEVLRAPKGEEQVENPYETPLGEPWFRKNSPPDKICTIAWGFVWGGLTTSSRKEYAQSSRYEEVYSVDRPPAKQMRCCATTVISFAHEDSEEVF